MRYPGYVYCFFPYNYKNRVLAHFQTRPTRRKIGCKIGRRSSPVANQLGSVFGSLPIRVCLFTPAPKQNLMFFTNCRHRTVWRTALLTALSQACSYFLVTEQPKTWNEKALQIAFVKNNVFFTLNANTPRIHSHSFIRQYNYIPNSGYTP